MSGKAKVEIGALIKELEDARDAMDLVRLIRGELSLGRAHIDDVGILMRVIEWVDERDARHGDAQEE